MAARLILNADDFGLTTGINRAIAELHAAGALTSATLMANGPAFDDAVAIARANPALGVGCHVVLTDGTPVMPPESIRSLLGPDGRTFRPKLTDFIRDLLLGRIQESDIQKEVVAQIRRLQKAGIQPTHLDTHKHTHIFPKVARALCNAAERTNVPSIRNPFEPRRTMSHSTVKRRIEIAALDLFRSTYKRTTQAVLTTDGSYGISATGNLTTAALSDILQSIPSTGTYELVCHPGYNDSDLDSIATRLRASRDAEREALLATFANNSHLSLPQLIHYGNI